MPTGAETDPHPVLRDPFTSSPDQTEYDAIAELFLGEAQPARPTPSKPAHTKRLLESIVLGHLPGAASAWVVQYAGAVAAIEGKPVALIRVAENEISIEIIGLADAAPRASMLEEAIETVQSQAARVLLRLEGLIDAAPMNRIDALTILTGADDAAIVAAYRSLKSIDANHRLGPAAQIRAAIMGADAPTADRAIEQLRRAVGEFLHGRLTQAPGVHRIGPVTRTTVFRAPFAETPTSLIDRLCADVDAPPSTQAAPVSSPSREVAPTHTSAPVRESKETAAAPPASANATEAKGASSLASRMPQIIALESRCPYHESIELAAGLTGELHALAEGGAECVGDLLAVESWAKDHAKLLAKAEPALRARDAEAALHLFSSEPAKVQHLLNTKLRIHVLAKPGPDGFVCLPLNHAE